MFDDDFLDMMEDFYFIEKDDFKKNCKKHCPDYKSCKANVKKCKYKKKKKGFFF